MSKLVLNSVCLLFCLSLCGVLKATDSFLSSGSYVVTFESNPNIEVINLQGVTKEGFKSAKGDLVLRCADARLISEHLEQDIPTHCSVQVKRDRQKGRSEVHISTLNEAYYPVWYLLDSAEGTVSIVIEFKNRQVLKKLKEAHRPALYYS